MLLPLKTQPRILEELWHGISIIWLHTFCFLYVLFSFYLPWGFEGIYFCWYISVAELLKHCSNCKYIGSKQFFVKMRKYFESIFFVTEILANPIILSKRNKKQNILRTYSFYTKFLSLYFIKVLWLIFMRYPHILLVWYFLFHGLFMQRNTIIKFCREWTREICDITRFCDIR